MRALELLGVVAIVCYCVSALWIVILIRKGALLSGCQLCKQLPALLGLCAHTGLVISIYAHGQLDLSFFNSLMLVGWIVTGMYILTTLFLPVLSLGVLVYPVSGFCALLFALLHPFMPPQLHDYSVYLQVHILLSILAFSILSLAAAQALLLGMQDYILRSHKPGSLVLSLPSLQTMENLLFLMLSTGFVLLSLALVVGFFEVDKLFTHKIIFSIIAWLIYGVLLAGRQFAGWRGRQAVRFTLSGTAFLILAFFGSKLVFELILG